MISIEASPRVNEKIVFSNLQDRREEQKPKLKLRQIVETADIKKDFSKGDSTKVSHLIYTITEVIHDTIPSHRVNYLPDRYIECL